MLIQHLTALYDTYLKKNVLTIENVSQKEKSNARIATKRKKHE